METIFIIMIGILIMLAITDLVVGVSNDAVNFLVSAIGSKAAPLRTIMIIAGVGVLFGATFSNGMMEVARKGIFHPELFSFNEIMVIFLAVMLTDIILLDVFNTLGMPTSTTVSIVFELLGSALAMSIFLVYKNDQDASEIANYINSGRALLIIAGILLSIIFAFTAGAIAQFLSRILFSFKTEKSFKYYGALWGGFAITAITYFILIKGIKGSSFAEGGMYEYIKSNTFQILIFSFIAWSIILAILQFFTKVNILKIIVLTGTFALAMAFAGNDLVNFIGVPLAGIESYKAWATSGSPTPDTFMMSSLSAKVGTPTLYLLIAGIIMVLTLWMSKKARSVTETSLALSRQSEGHERFESSLISRSIVRITMNTAQSISAIMPKQLNKIIDKRFEPQIIDETKSKEDAISFDLIRASVNLMVAGILISIGTSLKLPLSTTYVTFMVAMGTSLADRAWGRESAVYRVSGVLSVIAGWFITAFVALTVSFIVAFIIKFGGIVAVFILLAIGVFYAIKSQKLHKKKKAESDERNKIENYVSADDNIFERCSNNVINILNSIDNMYLETIEALGKQDRKKLKKLSKDINSINKKSKILKDNIFNTVNKLQEGSIETAPYYVQVLDYLRETSLALFHIIEPAYDHVDNNHKPLLDAQIEGLKLIAETINSLAKNINKAIKENDYNQYEDNIMNIQSDLLSYLIEARKVHIKRIKNKDVSTRNSMLYLNILAETKNIALYSINTYKYHRDFIIGTKEQ